MNLARHWRAVLYASLLVVATQARGEVFTKNTILHQHRSPATIEFGYDKGTKFTGALPVGTRVHLVYGVQIPSSNVSTENVSVEVDSRPDAFVALGVRCVRFSKAATGVFAATPFTAGCTLPTLSLQQQLSVAEDKVIVVVDGYYKEAGSVTTSFHVLRGTTRETVPLNAVVGLLTLPADLAITKDVRPKGSTTGAQTATAAIGGTITYTLTVRNLSAVAANGSTDVFLGSLMTIFDAFSAPPGNDVRLGGDITSLQCKAGGGSECPAMPPPSLISIHPGASHNLQFTYPGGTNGFLPAGGWFEITFDLFLKTWDRGCSTRQNEQLINDAWFTLSVGSVAVPDFDATNNTTRPKPPDLPSTTLRITGLPVCEAAPPINVEKELIPSGAKPNWGQLVTYRIRFTNQSGGTLTGLGLEDYVNINTPPFTAAFAASSATCKPACIAPAAVSNSQFVSGTFTYLFGLKFAPLPDKEFQEVEYQVRYDTPCTTERAEPSITNRAWVTGPAGRITYDEVVTAMPQPMPCALQVVKSMSGKPDTAASFEKVFPATVNYVVEFRNTSPTQSVRVGTIFDRLSYDSAAYARDLPISYSYSCTAVGQNFTLPTGLLMTKQDASVTLTPAGWRLIDLSRTDGLPFPPASALRCSVTVMVDRPPTDDGKCQGTDANLVNTAVLQHAHRDDGSIPAAVVSTPLPKCVSISVGKTVEREPNAGGPVRFFLTVKNGGSDPVSNVVLTDNIPAQFTNVSWTCASGCTAASGTRNDKTHLEPIAPGATVTVTVNATAPTVVGAYCNTVTAAFDPVPAYTFFEGDHATLTRGLACVNVQPPLPPKPIGLTVKKVVEGALPPGFKAKFTFLAQCATPAGHYKKEVAVDWPLPGFTVLNDIPPGSDCTVTEGTLPSPLPAGFSWSGLPVYTPAGAVKVPGNGATITVTNKIASCNGIGQITITKVIEGLPKDYAGVFEGTLQCWTAGKLSARPIRLTAPAELSTTVGSILLGSTCTFQETGRPALPPGWQWNPPSYSPAFGTVTADSGGCKQITVTNRARQCCSIE